MKSKQIHLKLGPKTLAQLRVEAEKSGLSVQNFIRLLIANSLQGGAK
jgi:predicted DNA binding CopG/RHH family protein